MLVFLSNLLTLI